jgi:peptide/nickel transport system substrate-binding protein
MGTPSPSQRRLPRRLFAGLLALVFAITACGWLTTNLAAQGQKKGDDKKGQRPKEEEEERPTKPRKVIKVDDDDPMPAKPRPKLQPPPEPQAQTSILEAMNATKNPDLKAFLRKLLKPHDRITVRGIGESATTYAVEPLARYYSGEQPRFEHGYVEVFTYDAEWKLAKSSTRLEKALSAQPYEEFVLDSVDSFLKTDLDRLPPTNSRYLARADMLTAAETVLAATDRFHASARASGKRVGEEWNDVGQRLHKRLFEVQLDRLDTFVRAGDWDGASAYARTLADAYREPKERTEIAAPLVKMIGEALNVNADEEHLRESRKRLGFVAEMFPGTEAVQRVADNLRRHAENYRRIAEERRKAGNLQGAKDYLELANSIYPNLPGLADEIAKLDKDHPTLRVGVRELPVNMIPGQATTDADLRAVELLYEGLVKLRVESDVGQRYEPALAGGTPRLVPLGREFRIARGATWSDGNPVTVGDVKETLRAMRQERWPGYSPVWNGMIEDAEGGGDSFRLSLRLSQGYLDPLSLMTFKVLSAGRAQAVVGAVLPRDAKPLGSGPYQYEGMTTVKDWKAAVFLASPGYESREGKLGLPRIREIDFVRITSPTEAVKALRDGDIDLLLDLSARDAADIERPRDNSFVVSKPMANRRVYFLAVNHRIGPLKGKESPLRQALALAIDREKILDTNYRVEKGKPHHSLNGPFPAGSWPCDPDHVPADLHNASGAKTLARRAVEQAGGPIKLTLLYPEGDPATKAALEQLCHGVNEELRSDDKQLVELQLQELAPEKLRERVEAAHDYQLAYYHYDHPSDAYWLGPLFDIRATDINGSNYLGYIDSELSARLVDAKNRRDFSAVQERMRLVHRRLAQEMPLIPLWQLDTFIAYRKGLKPTAVDPLLIFNDVERWTLEPKR